LVEEIISESDIKVNVPLKESNKYGVRVIASSIKNFLKYLCYFAFFEKL